jgi:hypothetical protein
MWKKPPLQLCSRDTNWTQFQDHIDGNINLNLQLETNQDLEEAVEYITQMIQTAAWTSTPNRKNTIQGVHILPQHIRELVYGKRRARRRWQDSINPLDRTVRNNSVFQHLVALFLSKN